MKKTAHECGVSLLRVSKERRRHNLPKVIQPNTCSASTIKKIQDLVDQGMTQDQVAAACNVNRKTVKKYGLKPPQILKSEVSDAQKQQIIQLALDGFSVAEIARISKSTIRDVHFVKFFNDIQSPGEEKTYDEDTIEEIQKQLRAGKPQKSTAEDCGVSLLLVQMVKQKFGIIYRQRKTSDDKIEMIIKCISKGMSEVMTAKECGVSPCTIRKVCKARNIKSSYVNRITPAMKEDMKKRLEEGETIEAVAKACGCSVFSVASFKKEASIIASPSKKFKELRLAMLRRPKLTDRERKKIQRLLLTGKSILKVAMACGRCISTVSRLKNKMQLHRPPARRSVANLEQVEKLHQARKDSFKMAERRGASIATIKHVNYKLNAQAQSVVKEEQADSLSLCTEIAPGRTSAAGTMARIEFLDEIPFCILI
ncbi:hypothetical protein BC940DRAFT_338054 [Gongronella butleri]|nr:hypothetical protein BC940DRAFT_338054 [Gongronella butleri]